jgi:hypothetical protein
MGKMDDVFIKRRHRELSKQQAMYVAKRETGASREVSAIFAAGQKAGDQVEESPVVQEELAKARADLAKRTGITREDIASGLQEAIDMARTMADPQAMIRGYSEMAKLLGLNAPEVKKHLHGVDPETRDAIKRMTDADLHRLAKGTVIDGTATVVKE